MAKYNYNKKALKGLTPMAFLDEVKTRNKKIAEAPDDIPNSIFNPNVLAKKLHPVVQHVKIDKIIDRVGGKSFVLVPNEAKGTTKLAFFRGTQYVSVYLDIDGAKVQRPYGICSSPKDALGEEGTSYMITVKETVPGFVSTYMINNLKEGDELDISGPQGEFYYQDLRDAKSVVAIAGGSGITPFYSMVSAVADGIEDFDLTILYGNQTEDSILLKDELEEICKKSKGKVKVVYILSGEEKDGYEHGYINADIIKKYAPKGDYSVFICGSKAFYEFMDKECKTLNLPDRRVRMEMSGDYTKPEEDKEFPKDLNHKEFKLTVNIRGEKQEIPCRSDESLLISMEKAGIKVPSRCRSGECGFCHSKLDAGEVYIPEKVDGRRMGDKKFGWVHPCCTFPLSDIELEVYPILENA